MQQNQQQQSNFEKWSHIASAAVRMLSGVLLVISGILLLLVPDHPKTYLVLPAVVIGIWNTWVGYSGLSAAYRRYRDQRELLCIGPSTYQGHKNIVWFATFDSILYIIGGWYYVEQFFITGRLSSLLLCAILVSAGVTQIILSMKTATILKSDGQDDAEVLKMGSTYKASRRLKASRALFTSTVQISVGCHMVIFSHGVLLQMFLGATFLAMGFMFMAPGIMLICSEYFEEPYGAEAAAVCLTHISPEENASKALLSQGTEGGLENMQTISSGKPSQWNLSWTN